MKGLRTYHFLNLNYSFKVFLIGFRQNKNDKYSNNVSECVYLDQTGYGPDDWHIVWKHCSGRAQSPINIRTKTAQNDPHLGGLRFTSDNENGKVSGKLTNNGHAPTLAISKVKGTASMTGGPFGDGVYKLEQFHFHFGCKKDQGSEHTVNGDSYSGEVR